MNRIVPLESKTRLIRPQLQRSINMMPEEFPKPKLMRQTNEHECLPRELWLRWWNATPEDKHTIWMEYEATTW